MYGQFFGEYLYESGCITRTQLAKALYAQRDVNLPLGALAMEQGALSPEDVQRVVDEQRERTSRGGAAAHTRFGTLAVEMGLLDEARLPSLLASQAERHLYLGEALVSLGYMTYAEVSRRLETFASNDREVQAEIAALLARRNDGGFAHALASLVQLFCSRATCGHVKVTYAESACTTLPDVERVTVVQPAGESPAWALGLARRELYSFAYCLTNRQTTSNAMADAAMVEFATTVAYAVGVELVRHGSMGTTAPARLHSCSPQQLPFAPTLCMRLESPVGALHLLLA